MTKAHILIEIKRTALANGGVPLGMARFQDETGIRKSEWFGKHWARWSEAVQEAGFTPNSLQAPYDKVKLLEKFAQLCKELKRLPSDADVNYKHHRDRAFPPGKTLRARFGVKAVLIEELTEFCRDRHGFEDVAAMCSAFSASKPRPFETESPEVVEIGFVYLLKHGSRREYKLGRTNNPLRREGEIGVELPEKIQPIHVIKTDDPAGVEAYWHRRFAEKRKEGEWFALRAEDVRAFKRWKRIY